MEKTNYSVARVQTYTRASIIKAERHNERKNTTYSNMNIDLAQTQNNVHYKKCDGTYNERLKEMIDTGDVSLRGLKDNAKVFDEIIFDINSDYFEQNGGYEFAKEFYEKAFHFAEQEMGAKNIISAVMHADELNTALTEEYGKPIYHYHLHVIAIPVVKKEIKWSKRCKDKSLIGTTKEIINQVSHSKKWKSQQVTDLQGNPLYDEKGKAILIKSYSLLQDRFFQYMSDSGYRGFIRGEKGSTAEHLSDIEFKAKKEREKLEAITDKVKEQQSRFAENTSAIEESEKRKSTAQQELNDIKKDIDNYKGYKGDIDNIDVGKSKLFGKKVELDTDDYQNLVKYAKKGIVSDVEITKLKEENKKLKHDFNELKEKARDFIRAIAYAPTRVVDFFKSLFKEEEQEKQRNLELAERQRLEKLYTPAEREILANITDYDKAYLNRFEGETKERVERGLIEEYKKELKYKQKINSPEYKKRRATRNAR
ncbi:MAG: plasmid recombination protein [Clostridia bacterium]|nr:plasmid recombination protein [Clostridia bacterium]